ncbi:MAG TPA: HD domain-containing phosphohydrolase [Candidatus Krumholzibacteria bacterium]|nr:HD domain-containing phosphohydrolase [Candidatus Krumholzibacteria bacterium]
MQLRATFESVRTDDPRLFVVKVAGHLGTRERRAVEDLVERCRSTGKDRVVFDFGSIESLGGSVAKVLGSFARDMEAQGHPPWFVGASPVVQSFLTARFTGTTPRFADDLETARASLDDEPTLTIAPSMTDEPDQASASKAWKADPAPVAPVEDADAVSRAVETLSAEELLAEADGSDSGASPGDAADEDRPVTQRDAGASGDQDPARLPPALDDGVTRRHSYLTLADAQPMLQELGDLRAVKPVLEGLLHGADLAETVHLFVLEGDRLARVPNDPDDDPLALPASGEVCNVLQRRAGPVDLIDVVESDLGEDESDVLTRLNCQVVVPVFVDDRMEGVFFVRKSQAGEEYVSSEELALDLLARQVGQDLDIGRRRQRGEPGPEEKKLRAQLRRQRSVMQLGRELHRIDDEERLISRLMISLIGEMGVASAIYLVVRDDRLVPEHCYGIDADEIGPLPVVAPERVAALDHVLRPESADPDEWGASVVQLDRLGVDVIIPLRGNEHTSGLLALAARRAKGSGNFDPEYLQALIHQAGVAAENVRSVRALEDQALHVARTLVTLNEKRIGASETASTDLVVHYVARVAERMNYDREHRLDLLYGAVLRDVGMIEISDLVLKSPRNLTPEEWKLVQRHPIAGAEILRGTGFSDVTCDVVLHHHERFNGEGYPHRLRGTAVPQGARIVSVVESYVAMIRDTPYRAALSPDEAVAVLEENWEMRYDPVVIEVFVEILRDDPTPGLDDADVDDLLRTTATV